MSSSPRHAKTGGEGWISPPLARKLQEKKEQPPYWPYPEGRLAPSQQWAVPLLNREHLDYFDGLAKAREFTEVRNWRTYNVVSSTIQYARPTAAKKPPHTPIWRRRERVRDARTPVELNPRYPHEIQGHIHYDNTRIFAPVTRRAYPPRMAVGISPEHARIQQQLTLEAPFPGSPRSPRGRGFGHGGDTTRSLSPVRNARHGSMYDADSVFDNGSYSPVGFGHGDSSPGFHNTGSFSDGPVLQLGGRGGLPQHSPISLGYGSPGGSGGVGWDAGQMMSMTGQGQMSPGRRFEALIQGRPLLEGKIIPARSLSPTRLQPLAMER